ncbi:MAG: hypothetical protein ACLFUJ_11595 [Phycisphaerae bacterium]
MCGSPLGQTGLVAAGLRPRVDGRRRRWTVDRPGQAFGDLLDGSADSLQLLAQTSKLFGSDCYRHLSLADGTLAMKDRSGRLICFQLPAE